MMPQETLARLIFIALAVLAIIALISMKMCSSGHQEAEQAKQDSRTSGAYTQAAMNAVDMVEARTGEEAELKEVVAEAAKDIANAEGSDQTIPPAARDAALRGACRLPNYRDEPACVLLRDRTK